MLKKVGWVYKPDEFHTMSKFEEFDTEYGQSGPPWNKPISTPVANERWSRNGLTGADLFIELEKPIYGLQGDKKFGELLPFVEKSVSKTIMVSNWKKYPEFVPDYPEGTIFNLRTEIAPNKYKVFANAIYSAFWWSVFQPEWKVDGTSDYTTIDNPEYPAYQQKLVDWKNTVLQYLIPQGLYRYPGLPMIEGYQWYEDGIKIDQDPNHMLATATDMFKFIRKNAPESTWLMKVNGLIGTCIMKPYPLNVKYICGI